MVGKENVEDFYDSFIDHQKKLGISVRHRIIYKNLKSIGLKPSSNVLEVGCGIGTVSKLIIQSTPNGQFLGYDISPKSIEYARKFNPEPRAKFVVSDMSDFSPEIKFDFIVFPDVLEHIPVEQHSYIFETIAKVSKPSTKILINIPEPNYLNSIREFNPELLQIIDQSLCMHKLIGDAFQHGFHVQSIEPYSIHTHRNNYLKIVFYRKIELKPLVVKNKFAQLYQNLKVKFL